MPRLGEVSTVYLSWFSKKAGYFMEGLILCPEEAEFP